MRWITLAAAAVAFAVLSDYFDRPQDDPVMAADVTQAKSVLEQIREQRYDLVQAQFDSVMIDTYPLEILEEISADMRQEEPLTIKLLNTSWKQGPTGPEAHVGLAYRFPHMTFYCEFVLRTIDGATKVGYAHIHHPTPAQAMEESRFTFGGKPPGQYALLAIATIVPACMLYALAVCVFGDNPYKWIWPIFIVLGLGRISLNWNTGEWQTAVAGIQWFGVSASHGPYEPWTIVVSLPFGAKAFLLQRRQAVHAAAAELGRRLQPGNARHRQGR